MRNTINKRKKSRDVLASTFKVARKIISEADIRTRAFEIYQENGNSSFNEQDNWFYAERELNGYYLQDNLKIVFFEKAFLTKLIKLQNIIPEIHY